MDSPGSPPGMDSWTADLFLAWAERQEKGRYELVDGQIRAMAPERAPHALVKYNVVKALEAAIKRAGLPCMAFVDGLGVKIDETTVFEPDALVNCGGRITKDTIIAPNPVIVAEVISPSSGDRDLVRKYFRYFRHPAIYHYLIVDIGSRSVLRHSRGADGKIISGGTEHGELLALAPSGLEVSTAAFFEGLDEFSDAEEA